MQVVRDYERAHPGLLFLVLLKTASPHVKPLNDAIAFPLASLAREDPTAVTEVEERRRVVVQHYPVLQPLDPLFQHPSICFARRCEFKTGHGRREPTRQAEMTFWGSSPGFSPLVCGGVTRSTVL